MCRFRPGFKTRFKTCANPANGLKHVLNPWSKGLKGLAQVLKHVLKPVQSLRLFQNIPLERGSKTCFKGLQGFKTCFKTLQTLKTCFKTLQNLPMF